jgi:hypothetical protein
MPPRQVVGRVGGSTMRRDGLPYLYAALRPVAPVQVAIADGLGEMCRQYALADMLARLARRGLADVAEGQCGNLALQVDAV